MGVMVFAVRFPGGAPPPEPEFKRALAALAGSIVVTRAVSPETS